MFKTLLRFPLKTTELTGMCFDKLTRVFDGRNPVYNYQFVNSELRDDWEFYRQTNLAEPAIWRTRGWENVKYSINSVLIVDLPVEQSPLDKYPCPYFYWLSISNVISYEMSSNGGMKWIMYRQSDNVVVVIDSYSYRRFASDGDMLTLLSESPHDLGYCPARFFWSDSISMDEPDIKASPITRVLDSLDWYLFFATSKRHLDLYGAYPIYSGYEQECDHQDSYGNTCNHGFMVDPQGVSLIGADGELMRCPKCTARRIGLGSFVEVPTPTNDTPDMRNPVQILSVDRTSLDYNTAEVERLRLDIIKSVTGGDATTTSSQAWNEMQVAAGFESQTTVLGRIKHNFEVAQMFVDTTICRLRYGDGFLSASINWGTDFYLASADDLRARYAQAKNNGASESELDSLNRQVIETEYRNDPTELQRMLILADIEPLRHLSKTEATDLFKQGAITLKEFRAKLNFIENISRFEREQANVIEFGAALSYEDKINRIKTIINDYEQQAEQTDQ